MASEFKLKDYLEKPTESIRPSLEQPYGNVFQGYKQYLEGFKELHDTVIIEREIRYDIYLKIHYKNAPKVTRKALDLLNVNELFRFYESKAPLSSFLSQKIESKDRTIRDLQEEIHELRTKIKTTNDASNVRDQAARQKIHSLELKNLKSIKHKVLLASLVSILAIVVALLSYILNFSQNNKLKVEF